MLVQVEYQTVQKWVRVTVTDDCYDYLKFIHEVHAKFNLASENCVDLKDSSGVDVDADIFDELLRSATVSFKVVATHLVGAIDESEVIDASFSSEGGSASSVESSSSASSSSTVITEKTKAQRRRQAEGPPDSKMAKDIVYVALHQKPGGEDVLKEYNKTKSLSDATRRKLVNILVADMIESHGFIRLIRGRQVSHIHPGASARGWGQPKFYGFSNRGIPLPPPFCNNGCESFTLWARLYEVIQQVCYKECSGIGH